MARELEGRRALVTGSSSGLGMAIAKRLALEGARLVVHGRNAERAERVAAEIRDGDTIVEHVVDPVEPRGLRFDRQIRTEEPLIVAVARPEHHAVLTQSDRSGVGVGRHMSYRQDRHEIDCFPVKPRSLAARR